ncbi:NADH-quinone oxidoreductase subunit M [Streptomyces sp. TRM S81-3]|uniref:NADH-quinone oxidoreductase subunit M n=1 Tax=Streptomyces griseicoloratus TaxID=2752516 RepID=A0A926L449_9ACTN|nr:NADH-quinone oxidoreductase subunit M [Streptomyces griseicoloratus]MBD0420096.1 NADH-quinone oxidoreductase subunit M [Streptomyces griseicoloratus]
MLTALVFVPAAVALPLFALPRRTPASVVRWVWVVVCAFELALVVTLWAGYETTGGLQYEQRARWIPGAGVGYHVGVDGLSLPLLALTCLLFLACALYSLRETRRVRELAALFLFLETTCLGLFAALDLILFFVFFDLSIVAMYFVIAGWGHRQAGRAALKFFLYTFTGSLALLLGFIGLYLAAAPHTFDMVELTERNPLAGRAAYGAVVLLAIGVGLAVKTPTVPFHTWLPPAHVEAPAAGSAILAGVLLKMGTYGFLRIAMPMLPGSWRRWALALVVVGVLSVLHGALVALAQTDLKRMVAYTSVNHMGYVVVAVGAAAATAGTSAQARSLAVTGAVTQMVSHGLLTGALFLLCGVLYERGRTYDMASYSGVAAVAPVFAALTGVAAFASLGLPGFSGFVAEFQIFTGSLGPRPVATSLAVLGILLTAGLFLRALRQVLMGPLRLPDGPGTPRAFPDIRAHEALAVVPLLGMAVVLGVAPRFLLDVVEPASRTVLELLAR